MYNTNSLSLIYAHVIAVVGHYLGGMCVANHNLLIVHITHLILLLYLLLGRGFGPILTAGTVFASCFSGYTVVGGKYVHIIILMLNTY